MDKLRCRESERKLSERRSGCLTEFLKAVREIWSSGQEPTTEGRKKEGSNNDYQPKPRDDGKELLDCLRIDD